LNDGIKSEPFAVFEENLVARYWLNIRSDGDFFPLDVMDERRTDCRVTLKYSIFRVQVVSCFFVW
jgi:hypothetical protein